MADDPADPVGETADEPAAGVTGASADDPVVDETAASDAPDAAAAAPRAPLSHVTLATILGVVLVLALGGLVGWLGVRAYDSHRADEQRALFLAVGRQGAVNLTSIDHTRVDQDVQRILDSATGSFYDEFQQRAQPFAEVVRQVKSTSVGTVTEAGIEDETDDGADVLVAVTVTTAVEGQPEQAPRAWRMRLSVQKTGDDAKVAKVDFVA